MEDSAPSKKKIRILVVENSLNWQQIYIDIFLTDDFIVEIADKTSQALQKLNASFYDLVIIDLRLLEQDLFGFQGASLIRSAQARGAKTLVCTGFGSSKLKRAVLKDFGADKYLQKEANLSIKQLRAIIWKLLAKS